MSSTQLIAAADSAVRLPVRLVATVVSAVWFVLGGLVLLTWYGLLLPVLWLVLVVPFSVVAAFVTRRQHSSGHLGRRLRAHRDAWRSNRGYRFARLRDVRRRIRRWGR
jgi:hypothetical protein